MRIDRLLGITTILLNRGTITAPELAENFCVSVRTIYRDIDTLSEAGIPVFTSQGTGGGISLIEGYTIGKLPISQSEKDSIFLALQTLIAMRYPDARNVIDKISALLKNTQTEWVSVDFSSFGSSPKEREKFEVIRLCILDQRLFNFDYVNAKGELTFRTVEPIKLWFWGVSWYVWAFCRDNNEFRTFKMPRIKNPKALDEHFIKRNVDFKGFHSTFSENRAHIKIRMKFYPRARYRVYDMFDDSRIINNSDGTLEVQSEFPEDEWIYSTLLSFGNDVEVLEPEYIKNVILERMKEAIKYYEK